MLSHLVTCHKVMLYNVGLGTNVLVGELINWSKTHCGPFWPIKFRSRISFVCRRVCRRDCRRDCRRVCRRIRGHYLILIPPGTSADASADVSSDAAAEIYHRIKNAANTDIYSTMHLLLSLWCGLYCKKNRSIRSQSYMIFCHTKM